MRQFCPDTPIKLLIGGRLQRGLAEELSWYWDVQPAEFEKRDYGWGFVKLEPLFGLPGEKFLMLDSDTALTGPIFNELRDSSAPFIVDNEEYDPERIPTRYYDWRKVREIDPAAQPPNFVFNSGQWVGTAGLLDRADFDPWVEWTFPRKLRHPTCFFPGEQGILNYVLVQKSMTEGLKVDRREIMVWPGNGMGGLTSALVAQGTAPARIVHWAGVKKFRFSEIIGADLLEYFEMLYFRSIPHKTAYELAYLQNFVVHIVSFVRAWLKLFRKKVTR